MKWIKVDPANLPVDEVLALGYNNTLLIGDLKKDDEGIILCDDMIPFSTVRISYVTHYILAEELLKLEKE